MPSFSDRQNQKPVGTVLFYGNCQTDAAHHAIKACNPDIKVDYAGNSNRVQLYDPARSEELLSRADMIVTQPIMNMDNPENHLAMRERFGDRVIFMPYIFVFGIHSLSLAGPINNRLSPKNLHGGNVIAAWLRQHGLRKTIFFYRTGRIDFQHRKRFDETFTEMKRREDRGECEITVSDDIERLYRSRRVMLTHNHPTPELVNIISGKIAARLGLEFSDIEPENVQTYSRITLPLFQSIVTPWCKNDLELDYPYDLHWFPQGVTLIRKLAETLEIDADS